MRNAVGIPDGGHGRADRRGGGRVATWMVPVLVAAVGIASCSDSSVNLDDDGGPQGTSVGPAGGTVTFESGVTIVVPPGALTSTVTFTADLSSGPPPTDDPQAIGTVYRIGPSGTDFAVPARIRIPLPAGHGADPGSLLLLTIGRDGGLESARILQSSSSTLSGEVSHLSPFWASASRGDPADIEVAPDSLTMEAGSQATVVASVTNLKGESLPAVGLEWTSSNSEVATVSPAGTVQAQAPGEAMVSVRGGTAEGSVHVTVVPGAPAEVVVEPSELAIVAGESAPLQARVFDAQGNVLENAPVTWSASVPQIAAVSETGLVTGVSAGSTSIEARSGTATGIATVLVTGSPGGEPTVIEIVDLPGQLVSGETAALRARVLDGNGDPLPDAEVTWSVDDQSVLRLDQDDEVTAIRAGEAVVSAHGPRGLTASQQVLVVPGAPQDILLVPEADTIDVGSSLAVAATVLDFGGNELEVDLQWSSGNPGVASVDSAGTVTGVAPGAAEIHASAGGVSGSMSVLVTDPDRSVEGIRIVPALLSLPVGGSATLAFEGFDSDGLPVPLPDTLGGAWGTDAPAVATVSSEGVVVAIGPGTAVITVTAGAWSATATVTVTIAPPVVVEVEFMSPSADTTMTAGAILELSAVARDAAGEVVETPVSFSSSAPAVAQIVGGSQVEAREAGAATLTATADGISASVTVTVEAGPASTVAFVAPEGGTLGLAIGGTFQTSVAAADAFGNPVTSGFGYSSSNGSVATVSGTGLVTAVALGEAWIRVTVGDGAQAVSDSVLVEVGPGALSTVVVSPASATAESLGDTLTFAAEGRDASGNVLGDVTFAWSVDEAGRASVLDAAGGMTRVVTTGVGPVVVSVTGTRGGVEQTASANLAITQVPASMDLEPNTASLTTVGQTVDLSGRVTVRDARGTAIPGAEVGWTSGSPGVATVDGSGVVTAVSSGQAVITASSGGASATATVTVTIAPPVESIEIDPSYSTVAEGASVSLAVIARDAEGNPVAAPAVTWSSGSPTVVAVSAEGVVTGVSEGVAIVTAQAGALTAEAAIGVVGTGGLIATALPGGSFQLEVAPGSEILIPITLDMTRVSANGDLGSILAVLEFDPAVLSTDAEEAQSGLSGLTTANVPNPGEFRFGFIGTTPQGSGDLVLVTVPFTVSATATPGTTVELTLRFPETPTSTSFVSYPDPVAVSGTVVVRP